MLPTREPESVLDAARSTVAGGWITRVVLVVTYLVAGALNAQELMFGARPGVLGVMASTLYLAAWWAYVYAFGRFQAYRALRRGAIFWAITFGGMAICGTLLRLQLGTGAAIPWGWVVPTILLVVVAPLYGLAGWFGSDPLGVLIAVTVGAAILASALALSARRVNPPQRTA